MEVSNGDFNNIKVFELSNGDFDNVKVFKLSLSTIWMTKHLN